MSFISWIPLFPLLGFIFNFVFGRYVGNKIVAFVGCAGVLVSFVIGFAYFLNLSGAGEFNTIQESLFTWFQVGGLKIEIAFLLDQISGLMVIIITGIGFLIHLYSVGYMHNDERTYLFFAYLNLFVFFMLLLVLGNNLLLLFIGWEGVGLCSYLLIGFYSDKASACVAAKKAFIVNRIGDFGILIAILFCAVVFGTLNFLDLNYVIPRAVQSQEISEGWITALCLLLFLGATGKSAQIPLFTWLPDAMEGPTPVSALIHAATMVTSGIYLIARLSSVFLESAFALQVIAVIGALTALVAALIAVNQNDIKKVLAYSTVSQLGFMFIAMGTGAFYVGMFHLMTHAFFKALLFLGAGAVIHSMHHEQDLRKMGGLKKNLPVTYLTFSIGAYALAGLPLGAGFFSKDEILWYSLFSPYGSAWLTAIGYAASFLTAFYIYRLIRMAFIGELPTTSYEIKESPRTMLIPLVVLAFFSAFAGFLGIPHAIDILEIGNLFKEFLSPAVRVAYRIEEPIGTELTVIGISVLIAIAGYMVAKYRPKLFEPTSEKSWKKILENKFYWDEFYAAVFVRPFDFLARTIFLRTETLITGFFFRLARNLGSVGRFSAGLQNGKIQFYFYVIAFSLLIFLYF